MSPVRDGWILTAMLTTELTNVGVNTLVKSVTSKGLNPLVIIVYSYTFASLLLLPFSFFSFRSTSLPPLTFSALYKMCLLGLIACGCQIASYNGIKYSSPTLAAAMSNVNPAFTFALAVIFRMENMSPRKKSSVAKLLGTTMSIIGALVVTFYHGPLLFVPFKHSLDFPPLLSSSSSNWVLGAALLALQCILISISYFVMDNAITRYPSAVIVTLVHNICIAILGALVNFFVERNNPSAWIIGFDLILIKIIIVAVLNSVFYVVHVWAMRHKGPVYLAMFSPLSILITAASSTIFLGESLYLGILIGGILITIGFYLVLWGKAKEDEVDTLIGTIESSSSQKLPLFSN